MSVSIIKSGILTTFQDTGRNGFRRLGINPGGAMDRLAARLINIVVGNDEAEAVLEMHFPAPVLEFEEDALVALGGADFSARLGDEPVENWRPVSASKGDRLSFAGRKSGARIYLAARGGFRTEKWLASAGTNLRAGFGKALKQGDSFFFKQWTKDKRRRTNFKISHSLIPRYSNFPTVRVTEGAEFDALTALSAETFLKSSFAVTPESDRMGFRLKGEPLYLLEDARLVSSAVNFGTIQLLPGGQMIILMADHQTTGGYPRLAHIAEIDLPLVAQLNASDKIYFKPISLPEAENLIVQREKDLNLLKTALKLIN
ncbi:MAG TPA: biotin-dependent carboxyltransferase family protein [Pyrinomonadaceae bacterium]|nr:biotin-dependent carboxyltransferase family protein [Pyrinomonadaceae bacterium]